MKRIAWYVCVLLTQSLWPHGLQPARLLCPCNFPGKYTGAGCHFPTPGDLPDPEIECASPMSPALAGRFFTTSAAAELVLYGKLQCRLEKPLLGKLLTVNLFSSNWESKQLTDQWIYTVNLIWGCFYSFSLNILTWNNYRKQRERGEKLYSEIPDRNMYKTKQTLDLRLLLHMGKRETWW